MQAMDLLFLIDGSGSFGEKNFLQLKSFLKLIVEELDMGGQSRMALIQFDHEVELEFDFDSYRSKEALKGFGSSNLTFTIRSSILLCGF